MPGPFQWKCSWAPSSTEGAFHHTYFVSPLNSVAQHSYVDQSPLVARRLGFAAIPLAVLAILVGAQSINLVFSLNSDFTYPWTWTVRSLSQAEVVYYATWTIVGLLSWLW